MKRIEVLGAVAFERWYTAGMFVIIGAMFVAVSLFESAWRLIGWLTLAALFIYFIVFIAVISSPMVVSFDEQWMMLKHGIFRKDIRMDSIIRVRYYIMLKKGRNGRRFYSLVMEIEYSGGRQELMESISKDEIEYCKSGEADKELFVLYDHIKELYPGKARGYWKHCGI